MAEGARLESVCTARYRGVESLPHRHTYPCKTSTYEDKNTMLAGLKGYIWAYFASILPAFDSSSDPKNSSNLLPASG